MKTSILLFVALFFASSTKDFTTAQYPGTNLRGRVLTQNYYGQQVPAMNTKVDLYMFNSAYNQWQLVGTSFTDNFGFYYFRLVNPGSYVIQINNIKSYNINVVVIDYRYYSYQDLPVILL